MVRIITDSAADFEPQELARLQIACIPLTVSFGDRDYQENITLTKDRFYELLQSADAPPKTAQPSPQQLLDLFEAAKNAGDEALYICLSSALSGTYQGALITQSLAESDLCSVVDSRNATGGQRQIVEYAVRLRDAGKTAGEIADALTDLRQRIALFACIDTLEYLYKGGRISHATYKLGTLANIKPIISVEADGHIAVPAKAMGMRKGMDLLCKKTAETTPDPDFPLYVMYTSDRSVADTLARRLEASGIPVSPERIIQVGAGIGSHIGPNACGIVYVKKAGS